MNLWRAAAFDALGRERFDLLVVGAGIIGSRIALEAARAGRRVALLDAGDFGGATSSASSKLIHGGLRYLQMFDLGLVRESHSERRALIERIAPHLVRPLRFVVPVYRGGPHSRVTIAAGLYTYSALSAFRHSQARMVSPADGRRLIPSLETEGLRGCGVYVDAQTHDTRLVLATVTAAQRAGAIVLNHAPVTALEFGRGAVAARVDANGETHELRAAQVVNAAGPWVDQVRQMEEAAARPIARLSKGVHLILPAEPGWEAALTTPIAGGRVAFALPWEGMLMLGTTDTEFEGDPTALRVEEADVAQVMREAAISLPAEMLRSERVVHSFAGLRVLPIGDGKTADARREHLVSKGKLGMISVAGGKLTTHRRIAVDVLRRVDGFADLRVSEQPLPGAGRSPARPPDIEPETWDHLVHFYGSEADRLIALRETVPNALDRIHPDGPDIWAQVHHAATEEWATTVADVTHGRTNLVIRGLATAAIGATIDAVLAAQPTGSGARGAGPPPSRSIRS